MKYLYELVDLLNQYDGSNREMENRIRDLVCYISDSSEYMKIDLYRSIVFEAAQKLRMFGYIKGTNRIAQDEFFYDNLNDIKHSAIQNYYKSKVFSNNLLDKRQKEVIDKFMSLEQKRILVSAPTSFGKTFLLREIIFLNRERYRNILLLFPTIALLNENTESVNQLIQELKLEYKIINNVYSGIEDTEKHIFILTPERALKLLADNVNLSIDFFFFDEVYKIDEDFDRNEDSNEKEGEEDVKQDNGNRAKAFRIVLYLLAKSVKEYYLAGPYLNLNQVKKGMQIFLKDNNITPIQIEFEPTSRIEIDAWKMNSIEYHPVLGEIKKQLYAHAGPSTKEKVQGIVKYLQENRLGQAIFYCSTPSNSMKYTRDIIEAFSEEKEKKIPYDFIEHLKKKYNVKIGKSKDSTMYWSLVQALENGIGIHHGKFPKYVQNEVLRLFNNGDFDYLFCTSTIIEGVNTNAKNVVIINNSVGNTTMTAFALKNIKGRAGRYYHHAMGRVFYTDSKQRQIENADDMQLNFQTYDTHPILNADIDNASLDDLAEENRNIKVEREEKFNRNLLPDNVFIKNRLYPRDVQEKYLNYVMQTNVFRKFAGLIGNSSNIRYFLANKVINVILETFEETQILDTNKAKVYYSVVSTYSQNGTIGILQYHIGKLQENNSMFEEKIDSAYIKAFEQIRNIVEYEIPKLLCLFESLFQQAGKLLGYNMDDFNLSSVIRFFELGITTELGLFLVEFGFPTDTIRALENKYPSIGKMGALEAATFLSNNQRAMYSVMDAYEQELFKRAMQVLVKRG
jgi:superfamily II DNA/RNA helicase|uniref:DEAD/DEAH box helicase n=1 Tax=Waltera intestinalis TaxID=2606635 RepID=UPI003FEEB9EF